MSYGDDTETDEGSEQTPAFSTPKSRIDKPRSGPTVFTPLKDMSTTEQKQQTPTPAEIPFTTPQVMSHYVTDTGKILPRKYTHLTAKHQRAITKTIKHSRNMLLAQ